MPSPISKTIHVAITIILIALTIVCGYYADQYYRAPTVYKPVYGNTITDTNTPNTPISQLPDRLENESNASKAGGLIFATILSGAFTIVSGIFTYLEFARYSN